MIGGVEDETFLLLHFDGSTQDSSPSNRSVSITRGQASYPSGKYNQCITSSSSSALDIYEFDAPYDDLLLNNYTIEFWFLMTADNSFNICTGLGSDRGMLYSAIRLEIGPGGGQLYIEYNSGNSHGSIYNMSSSGSISINEWHHLAAVRNGSVVKVYLDGSIHYTASNSSMSKLGIDRNKFLITMDNHAMIDELIITRKAKYTNEFIP